MLVDDPSFNTADLQQNMYLGVLLFLTLNLAEVPKLILFLPPESESCNTSGKIGARIFHQVASLFTYSKEHKTVCTNKISSLKHFL